MTAVDTTTRVVSDSGADVGPGERLREGREAAQLSVGEVASRLRLESRVVHCLENDDYDQLHGSTFVRGYLSGYARLLDLPERPILEAYERHGHAPPALVSELGGKPEVHVSDFPVRMVTYVIAGLLVVLVVLWWQSRQLDTGSPERADTVAESVVVAAAPSDATAIGGATSASPEGATDSPAVTQDTEPTVAVLETPVHALEIASDAVGGESQQRQPGVAEAPNTDKVMAPLDAPPSEAAEISDAPRQSELEGTGDSTAAATATESSNVEADMVEPAVAALDSAGSGEFASAPTPTDAAEVAAPTPTDSAEVAAPAPIEADSIAEAAATPLPTPLPGSDVLAIKLAVESWIEIYDRGGGRLYYGLAEEGSEVTVQGAGPMRVLLGEIEGALVAYNGEPHDLSRYRGRGVARFSVGELSSRSAPEPPEASAQEQPLTQESQSPPAAEPEDPGTPVVETPITPDLQAVERAPTSAPEPDTEAATPAPDDTQEFGVSRPDS